MKIALLSILIFSSLSLFAKHSYEDKSIINSRFIRKSFLDHKKLKLLKKGRKSGFYAEDIKLLKQKKKQILKKIIALFQGPIKIEEIENSQLDILSSKVYDPTNTYEISKAYVQYDHFFNKRIKLHLEKKQSFYTLNLDISNLSYGDHRANFLFKIKSKRKILWFKRTYYVYNQIDFKRVEAPSIFANLELESFAEGAYVKLDASNSTSESSAITNYEFISYKDGVEVDRINSEYSAVYLDFYDIGNYELQVKVTNDKGRSSFSEKIAHKALRTTPTLNYTLKKDESLLGHYNIDLGRTVDKDGDDIIFYRLTLYYLDAEDYVTVFDNYYETSKISFAVNEAGREFTLRIRAYDEIYNYAQAEEQVIHQGQIAPKYIGHYISQDDFDPTRIYVGAGYQDDGEIKSYIYTAIHEDGEILSTQEDDTVEDNNFLITKPGSWTFELYAIDNEGLKSDIISETVRYEWTKEDLKPFYINHYFHQSEEDERFYYIGIAFEDILGEVISTSYKATHESGLVIKAERKSDYDNELRFPLKGEWTIEAIATDNDGFKSEPFYFIQNLDWSFDKPIAEITLEQDESDPYLFRATSNTSYPASLKTSFIRATSASGEMYSESFDSKIFEFRLPDRGEWIIEYSYEDLLGIKSNTVTNNFSVVLQTPDGDIIPPHPGSKGLATLEGIDSDNDGIRDDIENFIYERNLSGDEKRETLKYVKVMQNQMIESSDRAKSVEATMKLIDLEYCLEYTFGEERANEFLGDLKVEMYASKERIRAFANTQMNFAGEVVTLDTDTENYYKYCEGI